ncbi:MAG: hypothetical protein WD995_12720 [Gemmatimonadota bacterium]
MTYAQIKRDRPVPWWAVFGAPLVGVPLVVAVLALVAPEQQPTAENEDVEFAVEQVHVDSVDVLLAPQPSLVHSLKRS